MIRTVKRFTKAIFSNLVLKKKCLKFDLSMVVLWLSAMVSNTDQSVNCKSVLLILSEIYIKTQSFFKLLHNEIICSIGVNIKKIASNTVVETIVRNVTGRMNTNEKDLCQDIYLQLITDKTFHGIINEKQEKYYIAKVVKLSVFSKTSRYYYRYKKDEQKRATADNL